MNNFVDRAAKLFAGLGALNWGTSKFLNLDLLTWVPGGLISTVVVLAIGASGAYLIYLFAKKKI